MFCRVSNRWQQREAIRLTAPFMDPMPKERQRHYARFALSRIAPGSRSCSTTGNRFAEYSL